MPPLNHPARTALERYPAKGGVWKSIYTLRSHIPRAWPSDVFIPACIVASEMVRVTSPNLRGSKEGLMRVISESAKLTMFATWRLTQGIYRIDPDVYSELIATPITGDIPADMLAHLPEWCIYIETPGLTVPRHQNLKSEPLLGAWAMMDWAEDAGERLLMLCLHSADGIETMQLVLVGSLEECLAETMRRWDDVPQLKTDPPPGFLGQAAQVLAPVLSLLLYLCAEAPEIGEGTERPANPSPKRVKGEERHFPAEKPRTWDVGVRMGALLRRAKSAHAHSTEPTGRTVAPHARRAHWHTHLIGKGRANRVLRWHHPTLVNAKSHDELPAVIRPVEP